MGGLPQLIERVTEVIDTGGGVDFVTARITRELGQVIDEAGLEYLFAGKQRSFTAFVEPHRHFIVHCSVHHPGHVTLPHDHGEAWAVYGVVQGVSRYRRFGRQPDTAPGIAVLEALRDESLVKGEVDVVAPGEVHLIANETDEMSFNVVVRPRPIEQVWRRRFDVDSGAYAIHPNSLRK